MKNSDRKTIVEELRKELADLEERAVFWKSQPLIEVADGRGGMHFSAPKRLADIRTDIEETKRAIAIFTDDKS